MPYAPGQEYVGGQLLFGGLSQFGRGIESGTFEALQRHDDQQKELWMLDTLANQASMMNLPFDMTKYQASSLAQKRAMVGPIAAKMAYQDFQMKQEQAQALVDERKARADELGWWAKTGGVPQIGQPLTDPRTGLPTSIVPIRTGPRSVQLKDLNEGNDQTDLDKQFLAQERVGKVAQMHGVTLDQVTDISNQHAVIYDNGKYRYATPAERAQATHVVYGPYLDSNEELDKQIKAGKQPKLTTAQQNFLYKQTLLATGQPAQQVNDPAFKAYQWATQNPNTDTAAKIFKKLGVEAPPANAPAPVRNTPPPAVQNIAPPPLQVSTGNSTADLVAQTRRKVMTGPAAKAAADAAAKQQEIDWASQHINDPDIPTRSRALSILLKYR